MTISELKSDIDFLCGSTSATYPVADKIRNLNVAYHDVARTIWDSADGWQFDDSNAADLPVGVATLVHGQQDYSLPSTAQRIHRIEVKDSSGNWNRLKPLDLHDVNGSIQEFQETPGMPLYYDVFGRSINLYPAPASGYVTLTGGLAVYFDREISEFPVTASTEVPGFATPFHRILSYAVALDFVQDSNQRELLIAQKTRLEQGLIRFYGKRNVERPMSIRPASRKRWRIYT